MGTRNFGLSNVYLKLAMLLLAISAVIVLATLVAPSLLGASASYLAGFFAFTGALVYLIGRIVQLTRSRAED